MRKLGLWIRYARHLPPRKIIGRLWFEVKVRTLPLALSRSGSDVAQPAYWQHLTDFWDAYAPLGERFVDAQRLYDGVFVSKGIEHDFGSPENVVLGNPFGDQSFEHWEHDLSFLTFLLPLASVDPRRAAQLGSVLVDRVETATVLRLGQRPSFVNAPIALSVGIMALGAVRGAVAQIHDPAPQSDLVGIAAHIRRSEVLLRWTLEKRLGFNHLVFGAAALAVAEVARGVPPTSARLAVRELERRLTADGFWSERSPTYHVHMLFVARALARLPGLGGRTQSVLGDVTRRMTEALGTVVHPDGDIAVFNDAAIHDAAAPRHVAWAPPVRQTGVMALKDAGYARLWAPWVVVVLDAGPMVPDEVIGHAHADFLSLEASVHGQRLIVDPGVASLSGGPQREWTRSSKSHNGPSLDGLEPAEFFGTWRVGRRGKAWMTEVREDETEVAVGGECVGYPGGISTRRTVTVGLESFKLTDAVPAHPTHNAGSSYLIPDTWAVTFDGAEVRLSHRDDGVPTLVLSAVGAIIDGISKHAVYPDGPMLPQTATAIARRHTSPEAAYSVRRG